MRHGKKFNHLGRTASHRAAMLSNMASSLILHKRINTTVAKAKALRKYVEPIITKAKEDTTHSRRVAFSYLQDKNSVTELFNVVAEKVADRPGGYTRILKTGARLGDNAEMCVMELVDFNELLISETSTKKTKRSRRGGKAKKAETTSEAPVVEASQEEVATEEVKEEVAVDEAKEEVVETAETEDATAEVAEVEAAEEVVEEEEVKEEAEEKVEEAKAEAAEETEEKKEEPKEDDNSEEKKEDK